MIVAIDKTQGGIIEVLTEWLMEIKAISLEGKTIVKLVIVFIVKIIAKY